jgi:Cys-tRNA(Pro)/Cys-tRNA(Cys) deacylase
MLALERAQVSFQVHHFPDLADDEDLGYGRAAARALSVDESRVFKTLLVAVHGGTTAQAVGVVPVSGQLSLKGIAQALGAKRAEMLDAKHAERLTGYVVGGISPFGQRRALPTVVDETCANHATIYVSGGRRGVDIEIAPSDLVRVLNATVAAIATV